MHWWLVYPWYGAQYIVEHRDEPGVRRLFELNTAKQPEVELYAVTDDPGCLNNLADDPKHAATKDKLLAELRDTLIRQGDPRLHGHGDCFDSAPVFFRSGRDRKTGEPMFDDLPPVGEYKKGIETFQQLRQREK